VSNIVSTDALPASDASRTYLYRAVWRWHFYAGLVVAPFLTVLALSGLIMLYGNSIETFLGKKYHVVPGGTATLEAQASAAVAAVPGGKLKLVVKPAEPDRATVAIVTANGADHDVSVDPNGAQVINQIVKDDTWFYWANNIHGKLMIGDIGDRIMEITAGLGIVLVLSGLYLWWPRGRRSFLSVISIDVSSRGRPLWKQLHATTGFWFSLILLGFLISGLAWTGVWGRQIVQAWSTFPAAKWDNVPLSDKTHAAMNHGAMKEVPWALEQTPMPASGSQAGATGLPHGVPVNLDTVATFARTIGFEGQYRIVVPADAAGVYTVSADSMDGDTTNPMGDHTVHIDRYTGKILADVKFADYSLGGKAMAVGVALHQGNVGLWNTLLNLVFCLGILVMTASGIVMWWKRRPAGALGAPRYPRQFRPTVVVAAIAAAVCLAFPLTGIAIIFFAAIDFFLPRRVKEAVA
jgi:uncharacterized iron-regulated membrane protein